MTNPDPSEEPKLIIDEDWKTQVQREKEELIQKQAAADSSSDKKEAKEEAKEEAAGGAGGSSAPPPASLPLLITTLATQAMSALGMLPDEDGNPLPIHLEFARHFIDLIAIIEEKTKGNLTTEEQSYIQEALYQLRLAFVAASKQVQAAGQSP